MMLTEVRCACIRVKIIKGCMGHFGMIIKPLPWLDLNLWPKPASNPSKETKKRGFTRYLRVVSFWGNRVPRNGTVVMMRAFLGETGKGFWDSEVSGLTLATPGRSRETRGGNWEWEWEWLGRVNRVRAWNAQRQRRGRCRSVYLECCFLLFSLVWKSEANNNTTHIFIYQYRAWQEEIFPT